MIVLLVMSSHSDIFLQNSGLSLIKSYIYDIGFENDKDCSDIDPLSPIGSRIEEVSKSIGYDLEADSEVKLEYVVRKSILNFIMMQ